MLITLTMSCTVAVVDNTDLLKPSLWSPPESGLSIRLVLPLTTFAPEAEFPLHLFVRASSSTNKPAHLLQGRFVYTFVPVDASRHHRAFSTSQSFSGGGGVDYTGLVPLAHQITAPAEEGTYLLFVTVRSTPEDITSFLITARVSAQAAPWWIGTMSTPSTSIVVARGSD